MIRLSVVTACTTALLVLPAPGARARSETEPGAAQALELGQFDRLLTMQFTPLHRVPPGTYSAYVTKEPLDEVVRRILADGHSSRAGGAWASEPVDLSEAFGSAPRYDRYRLARLYGGVRPTLARGPIVQGRRVVASLTLVSPHPDPSLDRLLPGTLVIAVNLPAMP